MLSRWGDKREPSFEEPELKVCVITTGKKRDTNVGDTLIGERCAAMMKDNFEKASVKKIFQNTEWENLKDEVLSADALVIACLAIRPGIFKRNYPFVRELLKTDIPICVVSAGISLGGFSSIEPITTLLADDEVEGIRALADRSAFFSSRGYLTQSVLSEIGVKTTFAGDVAFYHPKFSDRTFQPVKTVRRIAVSDPHYAETYRTSVLYLVQKLRELFPDATIEMTIHGVNDEALAIAAAAGINTVEMYSGQGLDHYDTYDLHVGYRVHGHVSALSRRKPSYLLEQDDRGTDYGATFSRRLTFASHRNIARQSQVLKAPVETLAAVLKQDAEDGFFTRFSGLERELEECAARNLSGVRAALTHLRQAAA